MRRRWGRRWHIVATVFAVAWFLVLDASLGKLGHMALQWQANQDVEQVVEPPRELRTSHPYYSHDLVPNYEGTESWGPFQYTMRTNSLGFRDATVRNSPESTAATRLLLIGDSFMEGVGIDFESTVAGRLARMYAPHGVEVLNAGVVSYSPVIYWKKIEDLISRRRLQVDAVAVFIDISDIQDEVSRTLDDLGHVVDGPVPPFDFIGSWMTNSVAYYLITRGGQWMYPHPPIVGCRSVNLGDEPCRAGWTLSRPAMEHYGRAGLRLADQHMSALAAFLRARRIPLTIVVYPWKHQLLWNDRASLQVVHWRQWSMREHAAFVQLFSDFFRETDALGTRQAIARYFLEGDLHWNVEGHRLVTDVVASQLLPRTVHPLPIPPSP